MDKVTLPPVIDMPTHDQGMKPCFVGTSVAIHTAQIGDVWHAIMVVNQADCPIGCVQLVTREELETQNLLLNNALEDAERLNAGKSAIHATPSLARN